MSLPTTQEHGSRGGIGAALAVAIAAVALLSTLVELLVFGRSHYGIGTGGIAAAALIAAALLRRRRPRPLRS
jgi:hypothetical protein